MQTKRKQQKRKLKKNLRQKSKSHGLRVTYFETNYNFLKKHFVQSAF